MNTVKTSDILKKLEIELQTVRTIAELAKEIERLKA